MMNGYDPDECHEMVDQFADRSSTFPHWRRGRAPAWTWVSLALVGCLARRGGIGYDPIRT